MPTVARYTEAFAVALFMLTAATPAWAWPTAKELTHRRLQTRVQVDFTNVPLVKAFRTLGDQANVSILLRAESLHAEGLVLDSPVSLRLGAAISLKSAIELILHQLHLAYVVRDDGQIEIVSPADLAAVERMYDVSRLLTGNGNRAARAALRPSGGDESLTLPGLVALLKDTVSPETWDYEGRSLQAAENDPHTLVISQSLEVHQSIEDLFAQLHALTRLRVLTTIEEKTLDGATLEAFAREQKLAMPLIKLDAAQARAFCKLKSAKLVRRHYVSVNGESFTITERLELQAIVLPDDSTIRFKRTHADKPHAQANVDELHSGEMLLLDTTDGASAKAGLCRYLTITPKVMRSTDDEGTRFDLAPRRGIEAWGLQRDE